MMKMRRTTWSQTATARRQLQVKACMLTLFQLTCTQSVTVQFYIPAIKTSSSTNRDPDPNMPLSLNINHPSRVYTHTLHLMFLLFYSERLWQPVYSSLSAFSIVLTIRGPCSPQNRRLIKFGCMEARNPDWKLIDNVFTVFRCIKFVIMYAVCMQYSQFYK